MMESTLAQQMDRLNRQTFDNSYNSSIMNATCPAAIQFSDSSLNKSMSMRQENFSKGQREDAEPIRVFNESIMTTNLHNAIISQDRDVLPDEIRETLIKKRRKDEAYKTALCDAYRKTKQCSYGENCRFAHGIEELRLAHPRGRIHPKYKTVLCENFSKNGICKYGERCQFIHSSRVMPPAMMDYFANLTLQANIMAPLPQYQTYPYQQQQHQQTQQLNSQALRRPMNHMNHTFNAEMDNFCGLTNHQNHKMFDSFYTNR
ncbi:unnamed protein product [Caenorhabditis bovis]|uniref:C3H1-type domain-containing protein n=1 Tax=Caenorhabditis bovis TaxID=2654633 RepID=A0A8S1EP66_9PELO|nr:unnamed protein product [Caenorhabditis bovis]